MFFSITQVDNWEASEVAVVEPVSLRTRDLNVRLSRKIDTQVGYNGAATRLLRRKNHARYFC
jgi:hypothetical protein